MKKIIIIITIFTLIGISSGIYFLYQPAMEKRITDLEKDFEKVSDVYLPKMLKDLNYYQKNPLFAQSSFEKNAMDYIEKTSPILFTLSSDKKNPELKKVKVILNDFKGWHKDKKRLDILANDPRISSFDVSWLEKLYQYDYWDLTTSTQLQKYFNEQTATSIKDQMKIHSESPMFQADYFSKSSYLYFIQKYKEGKILEGFKMLRHMSLLLNSTNHYLGVQQAIYILKYEHYLVKSLQINEWDLLSTKSINTYNRISRSWISIFAYASLSEMPKEITKFISPTNGICTVLWDYNWLYTLKDLLQGHLPLEVNFSSEVKKSNFNYTKLKKICKKQVNKIAWPVDISAQNKSFTFNSLPYIRGYVGTSLMILFFKAKLYWMKNSYEKYK